MKRSLLAVTLAGALVAPACNRSTTVRVEIHEGRMVVRPAAVTPARHIIFEVTNAGSIRHHVAVVRTTFSPVSLPVENGQVRKYTFPGEPLMTFYGDEGGWGLGGSPDHPPDPEDLQEARGEGDVGVVVAPGEVKLFTNVRQWDDTFDPGTAFVLYCDEPGHYERGEYAGVTVK